VMRCSGNDLSRKWEKLTGYGFVFPVWLIP
jgi:predicted solute-binding protein